MKRFVMGKYLKKCKMPAVLAICLLAVGLFAMGCSDHNTTGDVTTETHEADNPNNDPQTLTGTIQGLVVDVMGYPVPSLQATLTYDVDGNGTADTVVSTTDGGGHYHFMNVPVSQSVDQGGVAYTITINDPSGTYVTAYTVAVVNYADLVDFFQAANQGGEDQTVEGLMAEAVTVTARKPNITLIGFVEDVLTGAPISGAAVLLDQYLGAGVGGQTGLAAPTFHLINNMATTNANGKFTITGLPEAATYRITISATNYVTSINAAIGGAANAAPVTVPAGPTTIYIDGDNLAGVGGGGGADGIAATAIMMQPESDAVTADVVAPYVVSTNIPTTEMPTDLLEGPFTITFSEPMDTYVGVVLINTTGFRAPIANTLSWDSAGKVCTATPDQAIPAGMMVSFTINGFRDVAGNAYTGFLPVNITGGAATPDVFSVAGAGVLTTMSQGDSTLVIATNLAQVVTPDDEAIDEGGSSATVPQANNYNQLDRYGTLGLSVGGGADLGDAAGETDTVTLEWDAATGARQYYVYAELNTGGFDNGFPVLVDGTAKSGAPDTEIDVSLADDDATDDNGFDDGLDDIGGTAGDNDCDGVEDAIQRAILNGSGQIPSLMDENDGGVLFFDNGFTLNFAITAFNTEGVEGGFSNVVAAGDVTPPVVAEQSVDANIAGLAAVFANANGNGSGFSRASYRPTVWLTDDDPVPLFFATAASSTFDTDTGGDLDETIGDEDDDVGAGKYNEADWEEADKSATLLVTMSEDLDPDQTITATPYIGNSDQTWSITSAVILGTGPSRRTIAITIDDITQVKTGDAIFLVGVLDEAGNAANDYVSAAVVPYDLMGPFITSAVTSDGPATLTGDLLTITFQERVDEDSAETIGNYTLSAGTIAGGTAELQSDGKTVIITTAAEDDLVPAVGGTTLRAGGVKDYGYVESFVDNGLVNTYNASGAELFFVIEDGIAAVVDGITDATGAINDGTPAVPADDGNWQVGDTGLETYILTVEFSEDVFEGADADALEADAESKVTISFNSQAADKYEATIITGTDENTLMIRLRLVETETAEEDDRMIITYTDLSDLSGSESITLNAFGDGWD